MVQYRIFIAYANEDKAMATQVRDSLERINEFRPYLAADYPAVGENFKERIMNAIANCRFFIVFMTENGIKSQWVNQELGYACRVKKRKRNYRIIPISKRHLKLKGFITEDTEDLLFLDECDFEYIIANIFIQIRHSIPMSLKEGGLNVKYYCPSCKDRHGQPLETIGQLPSHDDYIKALELGNIEWCYPCRQCQRKICFKITNFEQITTQYTRHDPFHEMPFRRDPFKR